MAIANVPQGTLNRLKGSVVFANFPGLNVTAPYLAKQGISCSFPTKSTKRIPSMVGSVTSPEPYREVELRIRLLKTNGLSNAFQRQEQITTLLGDATFYSDSAQLQTIQIQNTSIGGVDKIDADGEDAAYVLMVEGYQIINSALYN